MEREARRAPARIEDSFMLTRLSVSCRGFSTLTELFFPRPISSEKFPCQFSRPLVEHCAGSIMLDSRS